MGSSGYLFENTIVYGKNGKLYNWMIIKDGLVHSLGEGSAGSNSIQHELLTSLEIIDLQNRSYIIPGIIDAHIHIQMLGESLQGQDNFLDLKDCLSVDDIFAKVKLFYYSRKDTLKFLVCGGWDQDKLGMADVLTLEMVENGLRDVNIPLVLYRNCYHLCVANSLMLMLLGLIPLDGTRFPKHLMFLFEAPHSNRTVAKLRDLLQSKPHFVDVNNGILKETSLFHLKSLLNGYLDDSVLQEQYVKGLDLCLSKGITSVQTNDFNDAWLIYKQLINDGKVKHRVFLTVPLDEIEHPSDEEVVTVANDQFGLVSCHRLKVFADGSLGGRTAALREPYTDCKHNHGILISSKEELVQKFRFASTNGFRLEIHVIGDEATNVVLEALKEAGVKPEERPILTHCQVLGKDLFRKMREQGVIANVQPSFVTTDSLWCEDRLGKNNDRSRYSYCWKTLLNEGIHVSAGSDSPVEDPDPFKGLYASIFRTYHPEERLTFKEAFDMYTTGAAFAAGEEDSLGMLYAGFKADFVILDKPIWKADPNQQDTACYLTNVSVESVWVDGICRSRKK
jgi:predicted amidohydrolase YtcJ